MKFIKTILLTGFMLQSAWATNYPMIIAHRGGSQQWPENTLFAFQKALEAGADAFELDVQVTKDGAVVLYHPSDLSKWTNGKGAVKDVTLPEIKLLNAGYMFEVNKEHPYRSMELRIPTLPEVLKKFPDQFMIVDMKSLPEDVLVKALVDMIPEEDYSRLAFYSTNSLHIDLLKKAKPNAITFETRDQTRDRLLALIANEACKSPSQTHWIGFEKNRPMTVTEKFALGEGITDVQFTMWSKEAMSCTRKTAPHAKIVFFGINSLEDYKSAKKLGADAVYSDLPLKLLENN